MKVDIFKSSFVLRPVKLNYYVVKNCRERMKLRKWLDFCKKNCGKLYKVRQVSVKEIDKIFKMTEQGLKINEEGF